VLTEPVSRYWYLLRDTVIVNRLDSRRPANRALGATLMGADSLGSVLGLVAFSVRQSGGIPLPAIEAGDSAYVVLARRGVLADTTYRADTIARIRGVGMDGSCSGSMSSGGPAGGPARGGGQVQSTIPSCNPLATSELAQLFYDGWIALVLLNPYRVDWRTPEGRWIRGAPLPPAEQRVTQDDKCAALVMYGRDPLSPCTRTDTDVPGLSWLPFLPPYLGSTVWWPGATGRGTSTLLGTGDGNLVIRRAPNSRVDGTEYDVVDRRGNLVGIVRLRSGEAIVGFGVGTVYTIRTDANDLQWLRRHAWP
jgi:hypothetical protein